MQQLMKSMREATVSSGMLDNEGTKLGTELLDSQYATKLTGLPGGLADAIARQLERQMGPGAAAAFAAPAAPAAAAAANGDAPAAATVPLAPKQADFVRSHQESARNAEAVSGIPAAFMVAQAAHESGWGRREIRHSDGSSAHNLFGIKAGAGWAGPVAEITTTEYVNGEAQKVTAKFRAYASYDESFRDYARLMKESPRYAASSRRRRRRSPAPPRRATSPRACSAPATPPTRPTPTSSRVSSTRPCACSGSSPRWASRPSSTSARAP
jgi:flagellar protein FlgJ